MYDMQSHVRPAESCSTIRVTSHVPLSESRTTNKVMYSRCFVDRLAVDKSRNLLFYTDAGNKRIIAMSLDGTGLRIVATNVDQPRALAVDKKAGVIYWTDWGTVPKIEKHNYDGSNRQTIASSGLQYPNGLALDVTGNKYLN
ncbi:Low-density lipoprotein receptor- protein 2 [Bulinus truncatus]|nr:Low-density lipoprotein receptor- protein 2 [Bulinus truncatus]